MTCSRATAGNGRRKLTDAEIVTLVRERAYRYAYPLAPTAHRR